MNGIQKVSQTENVKKYWIFQSNFESIFDICYLICWELNWAMIMADNWVSYGSGDSWNEWRSQINPPYYNKGEI